MPTQGEALPLPPGGKIRKPRGIAAFCRNHFEVLLAPSTGEQTDEPKTEERAGAWLGDAADDDPLQDGVVIRAGEGSVVWITRQRLSTQDNVKSASISRTEGPVVGEAVAIGPDTVAFGGHVIYRQQAIYADVKVAIAVSALVEEQENIVGRIWCQAAYADTDGLASTPIGPANVLHDSRKGPGIRAGKKGSACPVVNLVEKVGGKGDATIGYDPFGAHAGPESSAVGEEVHSVHGGVAISKKIDRNDGEAGVKIQVVSTAKFIDGSCDDGEGRAGAEAEDGRQGDGRT